jgi:hypothetical protein
VPEVEGRRALKKVKFSWITMYRIAEGKVAEEWLLLDVFGCHAL